MFGVVVDESQLLDSRPRRNLDRLLPAAVAPALPLRKLGLGTLSDLWLLLHRLGERLVLSHRTARRVVTECPVRFKLGLSKELVGG